VKKIKLKPTRTNCIYVCEEEGDASGYYYQSTDVDELRNEVAKVCLKFIGKVESGRARSVETYKDCKFLMELLEEKE